MGGHNAWRVMPIIDQTEQCASCGHPRKFHNFGHGACIEADLESLTKRKCKCNIFINPVSVNATCDSCGKTGQCYEDRNGYYIKWLCKQCTRQKEVEELWKKQSTR